MHRARALQLLGRFLDLGSWAVDLALSVGIFPYVLKLLQTNTAELRDTLVFIWTKILALDRSCQVPADLRPQHEVEPSPRGLAADGAMTGSLTDAAPCYRIMQADLVKDNGARYFVEHLAGQEAAPYAASRAQVQHQDLNSGSFEAQI